MPASETSTTATTAAALDPLGLVGADMKNLTQNIHALLGSSQLDLDQVAKYYIRSDGGKRIRPLLVLLIARTASDLTRKQEGDEGEIDVPISPASVLNDINPDSPRDPTATPQHSDDRSKIRATQRRLAEITEMIHAASLLHDDVIDASPTRRGRPSAHFQFTPKMSILAGDFMLGRASVALARLRNPEVTELLATVIANLVEGEFMQLQNTIDAGHESTMRYYLRKTYLKTASLIAKSCRASAILGGASDAHVEAAYAFGKNFGLAFQIVDDMLDYSASATQLGKPSNADLKLGLATAPVLFAWQRHAALGEMIKRKFSHEGDVELARKLALDSDGLERTRVLAESYCRSAFEALAVLPAGESRDALEGMTHQVLTRSK